MSYVKFEGEGGAIAYVDANSVSAITENHAQLPDVAFLVVDGQLMRVKGSASDALIDIMRERTGKTTDLRPVPF